MTDLIARLRARAEAHEHVAPQDGEQQQWMLDLREAADRIERLTSEREARAFVARCGNGIEGRAVPLYAHPAPAVPPAEPKREALHGLAPTHRCPACGAFWRQCDDASWNLRSASCCGLCDAGRVELVCWLDEPKREDRRGDPPALVAWSWHDLPARAAAMRAALIAAMEIVLRERVRIAYNAKGAPPAIEVGYADILRRIDAVIARADAALGSGR